MKRMQTLLMPALLLLAAALLLAPANAMAEPRPAHEGLEEAADQLLERLEADEVYYAENPDALRGLVDELLVPLIDFEVTARWVLGRHWRDISDEQREAFQDEFQKMLMRFYSSALLEFDAWELRFQPMQRDEGRPLGTVRAEAIPDSGSPVPVSFRVVLRDGEWRVFDVSVEGISAVTNYRSNFSPIIQREGMDGLLAKMGSWSADDDPVLKAAEEERAGE